MVALQSELEIVQLQEEQLIDSSCRVTSSRSESSVLLRFRKAADLISLPLF